jgi:heterodisulfide reductase subunit B
LPEYSKKPVNKQSDMKIGIYPGCSLTGSARDYNESVFALAEAFGLEFVQIPDWNCCGATAAHNLNKDLSLALPARIMALAEKNGLDEIIVPCAACYSRLVVTQNELKKDPELKNRINEVIEMDYRGTSRISNVIEFIDKYIIPKLDGKIVNPFNHKVACYYGCLLVRPDKVLNYDRAEDPQTMDVVMSKIGATPVDYPYKTECCGAGFSVSRTDIVSKLSGKIIEDAEHRGAEAIIVACPMCHSNLDMRRSDINKYWKTEYKIPVIFVTQAIGLAIGLTAKKIGLKRHFVEVKIS